MVKSDSGQRIHPRLLWFVFIERNHGDPLAVQLFVVEDSAAETFGDLIRQQVVMISEESFLKTLPGGPIFEERVGWLIFGGEDQRHIELAAH